MEVVVRFDPLPDPGDGGQVHGTVGVAGEGQQSAPFTGWLQLLSHLEALSGCAPAEQADAPPSSR
ncbi:hypothetical protein [Pseudonocardia nigra]|uniref:hypothetical protein n=1 Tax=Pseudonocardia nigra TaxID=1921578 RepID=UPI001C5F2CCD|nr:hypothetical protein [Pseudonocardia nigra]